MDLRINTGNDYEVEALIEVGGIGTLMIFCIFNFLETASVTFPKCSYRLVNVLFTIQNLIRIYILRLVLVHDYITTPFLAC